MVSVLCIIVAQTIGLFMGTWILGEWLPINSSACRPPWRLFTSRVLDVSDQPFTMGAVQQQKRSLFRSRASGKEPRQALTLNYLDRCLAEAP